VLKLDGTNVKIIRVVKYVGMKLHKCPKIYIIQDIMVVYLPPLFGLCLSREFIAKLGGYLAMDYSLIMVPCKYKNVNIFNDYTSSFQIEKMHHVNMTYYVT